MYVCSMRKQFSHCEKCKYKFPHVTFVIFLNGIKTFRGENQINPDLPSEGHTNSAVVK